ncbi:phage portal protein [Corynebacterium diphtheriae]|nr:phage portal protein [Corynebacterium diphtheriae]
MLLCMGIFQALSNARRLPDALAAVATPPQWAGDGILRGLIGFEDSHNEAVTTRGEALQIPAVLRGRNLLCTTVARTPIVCDGPTPLFIDSTSSDVGAAAMQTPFHRMLNTADDLLFNGVSAWALDRADDGAVIAALHIPLSSWNADESGIFVESRRIDPSEICIFTGIHSGLLRHASEAFTDARNLARAAARVAQNPAALIELRQTNNATVSREKIEEIIEGYVRARRGKNSGVGFSSSGLEVHEHEMAKENLLIEGRNAAAVDCARAMNVPAAFIDATVGGTSLSYQNAASRMIELVTFGVEPMMSAIESRLNQPDIRPDYRADPLRFDPAALLAAIPTTVEKDVDNLNERENSQL